MRSGLSTTWTLNMSPHSLKNLLPGKGISRIRRQPMVGGNRTEERPSRAIGKGDDAEGRVDGDELLVGRGFLGGDAVGGEDATMIGQVHLAVDQVLEDRHDLYLRLVELI